GWLLSGSVPPAAHGPLCPQVSPVSLFPVSPRVLCPWGQVSPCVPVGQVSPVSPRGPCVPVGQVSPVSPQGPCVPVGQVSPVSPWGT
uniref:Uncharacterized protein n=1 Tax=Taeniopygia guttata TaxID=59729 RepID=A0A674HMG1_TAEGU